ncbi:hypothetical protein RCC89_16260 [Cytophagaceae bacterium ABcell3]|nr:hypothetical protein RCC89_16260 [Cytophagaceae bacterium ABcell3]
MAFFSAKQSKGLQIVFLLSVFGLLLDCVLNDPFYFGMARFVIGLSVFLVFPIILKDARSAVLATVLYISGYFAHKTFSAWGDFWEFLLYIVSYPLGLALIGVAVASRNMRVFLFTVILGCILNGAYHGAQDFYEFLLIQDIPIGIILSVNNIIFFTLALAGYFIIHNLVCVPHKGLGAAQYISGNSFFFIFGLFYLFLAVLSAALINYPYQYSSLGTFLSEVVFVCMLALLIPVTVFLIKLVQDRHFSLELQPGWLYLLSFVPFVNFVTLTILALEKPVKKSSVDEQQIASKKKKVNLFVMVLCVLAGCATMVYLGWQQVESIETGLDAGDFFMYILTVFYIAIQLVNLKIAQTSFDGFRNIILVAFAYYLFKVIAYDYDYMLLLPSLLFTFMASFVFYSFFWKIAAQGQEKHEEAHAEVAEVD